MFYAKTAVTAGLIASVNAHMKMKSPAPFNPSGLSNAPLDASGSNFPCKFDGTYSASGGEVNSYALGSQQTLSFIGQAVHGGGSCQVSITYDENPTKDSVWKVIHSIEGGCPAKGVSGNMGDSAEADDPFTYPYTIPSDIPSGKATIAWTWFNKIGNREMYMNCGALELTGSGGDKANFEKLPDMVVLNVGGQMTQEGFDYAFKNPGSSVENNLSGQVYICDTDSGCTVGDASSLPAPEAGSGSGSGSGSGPSPTKDAPAATSPAAGGVFITKPGSGSGAAPATTVADTPAATPAPAAPAGGSGSGSSSGMSGQCSPEGTFNCLGSSYQQCASGQWSVVMPLAAGTKCQGGQGAQLNIAAAGRRRSVRAFRA
ncbi:hypothetical protein AAE478_004696 [Parahypoxylon ruwenzoriense]